MSKSLMTQSAIALLVLVSLGWASEPEELREEAQLMQREAAELAERGRK